MAQMVGRDEIESLRIELEEFGRSLRLSFQSRSSSFRGNSGEDENEADSEGKRVVDVTKLRALERHLFIEKLIKHIENDNLRLLRKIRNRIDRVGLELPTVEVRYKDLCVEAVCEVVHGKPLPTLWNSVKSMLSVFAKFPGLKSREAKISIIKDFRGTIKPGRMWEDHPFKGAIRESGPIPQASFFQTMVATMTAGSFAILFLLLFSGFVIQKPSMPAWLEWGFWVSPLTYGEIGLSVNEFLSPRWQKMLSTNTTIGREVLGSRGLNFDGYLYWISLGALFGFSIVFSIGYTLSLSFLKSLGSSRSIISHEKLSQIHRADDYLSDANVEEKLANHPPKTTNKGRMVLPFTPLTLVFQDVQYYVIPLLILLKTGGRIIYSGPLGQHSSRVIEYFQEQYRACKTVEHPTYWFKRSAFFYPLFSKWMDTIQILSMEAELVLLEESSIQLDAHHAYGCIIHNFWGIILEPRTAYVAVEVPYLFIQAVIFLIITYPMIGYYGSAYKIFWYFYAVFCSLMYHNYMGLMLVSLTPNFMIAAILSSVFYTLYNLFAGFLIPRPPFGWNISRL
ncbi:hypothetical protein GBA52_018871 [Prunus armeniaca]|nr:hypothetical protein GBA52_018871 [Prunus armeniaca]